MFSRKCHQMSTMSVGRTISRVELHQLRLERAKRRNEPPVRTRGEEIFNAVSHGVGGALAVAGMVLLLLRSHTGLAVMASCFYGISMVVMMFASGLYHALPTGSRAKRVCRRFDYTSIYLLIGESTVGYFLAAFFIGVCSEICARCMAVNWLHSNASTTPSVYTSRVPFL